jgi:hypothetical protein
MPNQWTLYQTTKPVPERIVKRSEMDTREISRRQLLSSLGLTAGIGLVAGCSEEPHGLPQLETAAAAEQPKRLPPRAEGIAGDWQYVRLDPATIAAEAYRLVPQGGCMYGLFAGIMGAMAQLQGEPYRSFPLHMMKYGEGGVGLWGSLCGTINGGAAIVGLFIPDKTQREQLVAELFSWYEAMELPIYHPKETEDSPAIPKTAAGSVLCHVSVGKWCKTSGDDMGSPEMKERCRRLTADVAAKTVELLNAHLQRPCEFAGLSPEVKSCLSCHGKELRDSLGKMQCSSCHQHLSKKHPSVPALPSTSGDNLRKATP